MSWSLLTEKRDGWPLIMRLFLLLGARPIRMATVVGVRGVEMRDRSRWKKNWMGAIEPSAHDVVSKLWSAEISPLELPGTLEQQISNVG